MATADAFPPGWHETNVRAILQIQVLVAEVEQLEAELKRVEHENNGLIQTNDMLRNANTRLRKDIADAGRGNCQHPWDRRATSFGASGKPVTRCSVCGATIPPEETPPTDPKMTQDEKKAYDKALADAISKSFSRDPKGNFRNLY